MVFALSYIDTKDNRFRQGLSFQKNLLPNSIRVSILFVAVLLLDKFIA